MGNTPNMGNSSSSNTITTDYVKSNRLIEPLTEKPNVATIVAHQFQGFMGVEGS